MTILNGALSKVAFVLLRITVTIYMFRLMKWGDEVPAEQRRMMYDKYGSQGFLDCRDVGIDLDRVDLSRSSLINGVHYQQRKAATDGVPMKDARGGGTPYKHLRDPDDVFNETFACLEPSYKKNGEERTYSGFLYDVNRFEHTFSGFSQTTGGLTTESPKINSNAREISSFKGSVFSSPTDFGDYVTQALSDAIINGRNVITQRTIINGREILTVEEDGKLVLKTVDGEQRDLA